MSTPTARRYAQNRSRLAGSARWRLLLIPVLACVTACGGGEPGGAAAPPSRSGEVWEVKGAAERTAVAGSIVAFVNGVHVMVVDGDQIYAGMTELATKEAAGGGRTITFSSGLSADLVPGQQGAELRFSTGERVAVGEKEVAAGE